MGNDTSELCKVCRHRLWSWVSVNLESKREGKKKENSETERKIYYEEEKERKRDKCRNCASHRNPGSKDPTFSSILQ
jgi:hypothetical protein